MAFHTPSLTAAALALLLCASAQAQNGAAEAGAAAPAPAPAEAQGATPPPALSRDAQLTYQSARDKLLQIRTLRRKTNTQSSVGSGFYVSSNGLIVTNFHVASQLALEPDRHRGVAVSVEGKEIEIELLAFDLKNDLAVLRPKKPIEIQAALALRPAAQTLARGERIYSLGNPLDIGFAVTEGTYNGLVQRSFYPRIFFGGALNPGMSGGPALDSAGRVLGVNVAKRGDAELVSFLIPVEFVAALLERAKTAQPVTAAADAEVARQLHEHQALLFQRFTALPFHFEVYGGYRVPVPDESLARCWGSGRDRNSKSKLDFEHSDCRVDSQVFAGDFNTGDISMRYEAYDGTRLHPLQFAYIYSKSFANEHFLLRGQRQKTAAECNERFINTGGMNLRAVICLSAYRKLEGLYDLSLMAATLNQPQRGVQARLDAKGLSFDNAMALSQRYLDGFSWQAKP
jgi:serine protease Do